MKIPGIRILAGLVAVLVLVAGCRRSERAQETPAARTVTSAATSPKASVAAAPAAANAQPVADWCAGHGVPESICTRCNPSLIPGFQARGDWCKEHGLPESQCTICHPELIEKFRKMAPGAAGQPPGEAAAGQPAAVADWCAGHGVPESVCTRCNPSLIPGFQARGDWCQEHGLPESQCTICHPELIEKFRKMAPVAPATGRLEELPAARPYEGVRVRLATPETATKAGIATTLVSEVKVDAEVSAPARLVFDETRSARVSSPVRGTVREVRVTAGASVRKGDPVLVIASPELAEARARLKLFEAALGVSEATLAREERLVARDVSPRKDLLEAKRAHQADLASVASARGVLTAIGAEATVSVDGSRYVIKAPRAGVVTDVHAAVGQTAEPDEVLAEIQDPSRLWAELAVSEADAPRLRSGDRVALAFEALPDRDIAATVTWLSPRVDPRTRTVHVRAELANEDGVLRDGMFGRGRIRIHSGLGMVVPGEAVQDGPEGPVAFVQLDPQIYEPRAVKLGRATVDKVEIMAGLKPGERVVTRGSFLLKTEIMKGSLGAGCCDAVEK